MGLGSRILNLFSPGKGNPNESSSNDDLPTNGEGINLTEEAEDPSLKNTIAATTTTATIAATANSSNRNGDITTGQSQSSPPPSSSTSSRSSSEKKKGHCNYPGCTRALFARGKCYRHDTEAKKRNGSDNEKLNGELIPQNDGSGMVNNGGRKANGSSNNNRRTKKYRANQMNNSSNGETSSGKKKRDDDDDECKQPLVAAAAAATQMTGKKSSGSSSSTSSTRKNRHCTHPGCTRALFARGKCYRHDNETNGVDQKSSTPRSSSNRSGASVDDDGRSVKSKTKNEATPATTKNTTTATTPSSKKKSSASKHCNYPGCTRALFARGKCYRHDTEAQRSKEMSSSPPAANDNIQTPSTLSLSVGKQKTKRKSSDVKSTPKSASIAASTATKKAKSSSGGLKHCNSPGCTRALFARGMCYRHDTEAKKRNSSGGTPASGSSGTPSPPKSIKTKKKKAATAAVSSSTAKEQLSSSGRKKKGHCNYPGCTRALFARGKCYRHDHETKKGGDTKRSSSSHTNGKKSNSKSAVSILPSLTKALTSSSQSSQRKSAIARRPRQLKPTEKLLAMQEDALALYDTDITGTGGGKKSKKRTSDKLLTASRPSKKVRVVGQSSSDGGVSMEELTSNTYDDDEEESNYDNVVCCLCKCGVDFSDADFFLPEDCDGGKQQPEGSVKDESHSSSEGEDNLDKGNGKAKGNLKTEGLEEDDYSIEESNGRGKGKKEDDTIGSRDDEMKGDNSSEDGDTSDDDEEEKAPFQLPHRFHNPRNGLILCDGPAHAGKRRGSSSNGQQLYRCERAYHQRCHFIPVFAVPRGPWRCLICRYRDEEYLKKKGKVNEMNNSNARMFTDDELNVMFRCNIPQPNVEAEAIGEEEEKAVITNVPPAIMSPSNSDIASLEHVFENMTGPLKARIMKEDLTTKAEKVINAALSNIRNSEHSLRSFTETSRSRKALAERIQCIGGLPQELTQCVMRIAQNKLRIKDLIVVLEESIRCAPHHVNTKSKDAIGCIDAVSELMQWYLSQSSPEQAAHFISDEIQGGKTLLQHLFPEGDLHRRRFEPRTGEAHVDAEDASVKSDSSGVSLDDLKCSCCHGGAATDDNDMLLCDGIGCYRAFHMQCLEPKMTLEEVEAAGEDEAWFCPLCTAHANLVHYAQREYLLDDWEHDWDEIMKRRGHSEWEMADDVFPEAELELRVAQKFKDGIKDDETTLFIAETFGIGGGAASGIESDAVDADDLAEDDEDEEDDEDFDVDGPVEEGSDGDSSAAEDMHEEKKLLKEKIGRDELDALSICSSSEESDSDASSDEDDGLRRSKRRRFTFPPAAAAKDGDSSGNDQSNDSKSKDMGALDVSNIVRGKRSRSKVDYRKLADTMFGDDSDEEAKGSVMKYDYKPKKAPVDESSDEDETSSSDEESDSDNEGDSQSGDK
eukprot:scaffold4599_cov138-Skeletonema_menzelii.AAC.4